MDIVEYESHLDPFTRVCKDYVNSWQWIDVLLRKGRADEAYKILRERATNSGCAITRYEDAYPVARYSQRTNWERVKKLDGLVTDVTERIQKDQLTPDKLSEMCETALKLITV